VDVIFNEYLNECRKSKNSKGLFKIVYDSCEGYPFSDLFGVVYDKRIAIASFFLKENREISFNYIYNYNYKKSKNKSKPISGFFSFDQKTIVFIWDKDPKEHFLCVSYSFFNSKSSILKLDWSKEGF
jgi:hypothetical protein